jgi:hypothetical protein
MEIKILIILVWVHFLGDFIAQTNDMAIKKSHSNKWLLIHVGVYMVPMLIFGPVFALVNGAAHLVTDYITSRLGSHYRSIDNQRAFFIVLGSDQAIHLSTLLLTYPILGTFNWF